MADHHIRLNVYLLPSSCSMCLHLQKLWVVVNDIEQNTVNVRPQLWIHFLLFLQSCPHLEKIKMSVTNIVVSSAQYCTCVCCSCNIHSYSWISMSIFYQENKCESLKEIKGHTVTQLVEAPHYKLEGHGFDETFHWHNPSGHAMALGSTRPLTEISTRNPLLLPTDAHNVKKRSY